MTKQETYDFLTAAGISYEITEHAAVYTMEELFAVDLPYPELIAKNLLVRNDKKMQYYLITVKDDKRVDLKEFSKKHETRRLSFASADDLATLLKLSPGEVTPLGLLNDEDLKVAFYLDKDFADGTGIIGCHPNDNTATVWIHIDDLTALIKTHGNEVNVVEI